MTAAVSRTSLKTLGKKYKKSLSLKAEGGKKNTFLHFSRSFKKPVWFSIVSL